MKLPFNTGPIVESLNSKCAGLTPIVTTTTMPVVNVHCLRHNTCHVTYTVTTRLCLTRAERLTSAARWSDPSLHFATAHWGQLTEGCSLGAGETMPSVTSCGQFKNQCHLKVHSTEVGVLAAKHLNKCQMTTHHARYRVCGYYIYDFPTLNRFYLFLYKKRLSPMSSCARDALNTFKNAKFCSSLINVCQPSNHAWFWVCRDYNYGFPTLTVLSNSYIERMPPVSSCALHEFYTLKT